MICLCLTIDLNGVRNNFANYNLLLHFSFTLLFFWPTAACAYFFAATTPIDPADGSCSATDRPPLRAAFFLEKPLSGHTGPNTVIRPTLHGSTLAHLRMTGSTYCPDPTALQGDQPHKQEIASERKNERLKVSPIFVSKKSTKSGTTADGGCFHDVRAGPKRLACEGPHTTDRESTAGSVAKAGERAAEKQVSRCFMIGAIY